MKIDKNNPYHWVILTITTLNILISLLSRLILRPRKRILIFYGHKYHGNLQYFFEYLQEYHEDEFDTYFLTMDYNYYQEIHSTIPTLLSLNPLHMIRAANATIFITDHGLHSFKIYQKLTKIKFINVYHGLPFKKSDPKIHGHLHNHDATFVTSKKVKDIYAQQFGFDKNRVKITGYARTDPLINHSFSLEELKYKYGISKRFKKIALIAPTWQQKDCSKSILPFDTSHNKFFGELSELAEKNQALIIFRAHLNTKETFNLEQYKNILDLSLGKYPATTEVLYLSDLLVSDWSSIVFDYLVLKRPTIFLDIPCPFVKGFTLPPDYRFGEVITNFDRMKQYMEKYLIDPALYDKKYGLKMDKILKELYDSNADGKAVERYYVELKKLLDK